MDMVFLGGSCWDLDDDFKETKLNVSHEPKHMCQLQTHLPTFNPSFWPKKWVPRHSRSIQGDIRQVSLGRRILTTDVAIVSLTTLAADALAEPVRMAPAAAKSPWSAWLMSKLC